ncbi:MAG: DUF418 domain-containing protein [Dermatophilaceae bacterium]
MSTTVPRQITTRQQLPDQLRGLALLGIVLVNMPFLAISNTGFTLDAQRSVADVITQFVVVAFAQGKYYLLFSFLFGYSLTLMLRSGTRPPGAGSFRADDDTDGIQRTDGIRRYRRRLVGLAALGLAHAVLFFVGDILLSYAVLGMTLPWFVRRSDATALRAAAVAFSCGILVLASLVMLVLADPGSQGGFVADPAPIDRAFLGSFTDAAAARAEALPGVLVALGVLNWPFALGCFLLGLVAGRRGLLAHPAEHRPLWRRLLVVGAVVGLPAGVVSGLLAVDGGAGSVQQTVAVALGFAAAPLLTGGYVALAALGTSTRRGGQVLAVAAPAGRMSLTGYLGESILLSAIFCGWGLGLFGQLGAFAAALIALGVWATLEVLASWWLARYHYGPFEWALRVWTHRTVPPLRR